ncbi:DUF971 domain-containing protein [Jeongeupia wiesaeckerbachi]|uniref:gamma-butyrobetaine hydroxylase-like domain-containing protein n=1 Tax=Jeongeupia wiesaeckerbachi TaxID=3051218 RepID=UPI003D80743B
MTPAGIILAPRALTLAWPDGTVVLDAHALRAACRCADCRSATLRGKPVSAAPDIALAALEPLGHYAVQLRFSDGHERGIYPWAYLRELAYPG